MFDALYKKSERSPKSIDLDFKNPRLKGYIRRESLETQKDIVRALMYHYDVIDLCKAIVSNGFHPDETLIVIPDEAGSQRRVTAIEGNRRLCACKVLLRPELLRGTAYYSALMRLTRDRRYPRALQTIKKLSVVELPGRKDAVTYLASKHTQHSIKGWSVYTQGAYLLEFKTNAMTLADLKSVLNDSMDLTSIRHRILFYLLSEQILDLECWSEEEFLALTENIDNIKTEAIIRLINSSNFRQEVGTINIDDRGNLFFSDMDRSSFEAILEKLARDTNFNETTPGSGKYILNTRQENDEFIRSYVSTCVEVLQATKGSDSFQKKTYVSPIPDDDADGTSDKPNPDGEDEDAEPKPPVRGKKPWRRLLPKEIPLPSNPKLRSLAEEAIKLDTRGYRYTSALVSRALIEITLKIQIKQLDLEPALRAKYRENAFNFENLLNFCEQRIADLVDDDDSRKAIRSAIQGLLQRDKEILNLTNHNDMHILSEVELDHIVKKLTTISGYFFDKMESA